MARELWKASKAGEVNTVLALLEEGADPNHPLFWSEEWKDKSPPLHTACAYNKLNTVKALVQGGADVNRGDRLCKHTPLHNACASGNTDVVQFLVEDIKCEIGEHMNAYILLVV